LKIVITNTLKGIVCLLIASILYGCGSDDESTGTSSNYLTGTWTQSCTDNGGNTSKTSILVFENTSSITITEKIYGDDTCSIDLLSTHTLVGTYTLGGDVITTTGETATEIDVTMTEENGNAIPVAFRRTGYRIVYVNGDNLYGGDEQADPNLDGTTVAKRSNILETTPYVFGVAADYVTGTWVYTCAPYLENTYSIETSVLADNKAILNEMVYSDSACSIDLGRTDVLTGTYSLGQQVTTTTGLTALELDLTLDAVNGTSFPGGSITHYDIAYRNGNILYHGTSSAVSDLDGSTAAKRLNTIDFSDAGVRQ